MEERDFVILGAGVAGLSAASVLGDRAVVLEKSGRPGGLARTECYAGYWFDHTFHLLYFDDVDTKKRIFELIGDQLAPRKPEACVVTAVGTTRYPFQMHLSGLNEDTVVRCLRDLASVTFLPNERKPGDFEEMLLQTFGRGMCDVFLFPYNRKMWKRPLSNLAPAGFQWNITRPEFEEVLKGALSDDAEFQPYNADCWYPRPPEGASDRGIEVLAQALAKQVSDLRLRHWVESIDLDASIVTARHEDKPVCFKFRRACLETLPLPEMVAMCTKAPDHLRGACAALPRNRVLSAALSIRGPRPHDRGTWRYYADESLAFNRLVYMHELDPCSAPEEGWGLLAEATEPSEGELADPRKTLDRIRKDVYLSGELAENCQIVAEHLMVVDPAYVVFERGIEPVVKEAHDFLRKHRVIPLGRFGNWEYSNITQVMREGFALGERVGKHF